MSDAESASDLFDRIRAREGLRTDRALAKALDISHGYLCSIRNGRKPLTGSMRAALLTRLSTPLTPRQIKASEELKRQPPRSPWCPLFDEYRSLRGLPDYTALAHDLGAKQSFVSSIRTGKKALPDNLARKVLHALGYAPPTHQYLAELFPDAPPSELEALFVIRAKLIAKSVGYCQLCGEGAPFTGADGFPFLELRTVRAGPGKDREWAVLCPNCAARVENYPGEADQKRLNQVAAGNARWLTSVHNEQNP